MQTLWKAVAWLCACPPITRIIIRVAMQRPYLHIGDYMNRYWLIPFAWNLPISIRVHHIKRPDADPYLHDHPWNWRTIVLRGWYIEEDIFGVKHARSRGQTRSAMAETLHRVDQVSSDGVWTLFIMGRKRNRWGFMVDYPARKIYYRDYLSPNGRGDLVNPVPNYES